MLASLFACVFAGACTAQMHGVSGVTAVVVPATQYNPCPVTMSTIGLISGSPGTPVTYRFIGNGLPWSPPYHREIPISGVLKVIERTNIDEAHAGYFFRQVWIVVDGGVRDKFSNRALYINTCAAPLALAETTDPTACAEHAEPHIAGLLCGAALAVGHLTFIWNWTQASCQRDPCTSPVGGYRIYQLIGKAQRLVASQRHPRVTVAALPEKASALVGNCYVVRAYRGTDESLKSNPLCVAPAYGEYLERVSLRPIMTRHGVSGNTAVMFDLRALSSPAIWNARLEFDARSSAKNSHSLEPCIGRIDLTAADARERSIESLPSTSYVNVERSTSIDVTSAVRAWTQQTRPNYGFILRPLEAGSAKKHRMCRWTKGDPTLAIDYLDM